jgi:hypothetical protein
MLYRARARAKIPAAPATPMATPPVGAGAPPVECVEEGEDDAELELDLESELEPEVEAEVEEVEVVSAALEEVRLAVVEPTITMLEPVSIALLPASPVGVALLSAVAEASPARSPPKSVAQDLTLSGNALYQAG